VLVLTQLGFRIASRMAGRRTPFVIVAFVLCVIVLAPAPAGSQVNGYTFFLERSYMLFEPLVEERLHEPQYYTDSYRRADDDLYFEARIAPHIFLVNTLDRELEHGGFGVALSFTPMITVRQLTGFSKPLKSPSFMPKVTAQLFWVPGDRVFGETWLWSAQAVWGHHSNGGSGCLFVEQTADDGDCEVTEPIAPEDRQVDTDGSFSTVYARFELVGKRMKIVDGVSRGGILLGGGLELNGAGWPFLVFAGGSTGDLRRIYGPTRLRVRTEVDKLYRTLGMDVRGTLGVQLERIYYDAKPSAEASLWRWTVHAFLTKDSGFFKGVGLFAQYYEGQDSYNLLFLRDIRRFQVGISFDPTSNRWTD
jgi:hypothetical protein